MANSIIICFAFIAGFLVAKTFIDLVRAVLVPSSPLYFFFIPHFSHGQTHVGRGQHVMISMMMMMMMMIFASNETLDRTRLHEV